MKDPTRFLKFLWQSIRPAVPVIIGVLFMISGGVMNCYNCSGIIDVVFYSDPNVLKSLGFIITAAGFLYIIFKVVKSVIK